MGIMNEKEYNLQIIKENTRKDLLKKKINVFDEDAEFFEEDIEDTKKKGKPLM
jgi:hypothetical protein